MAIENVIVARSYVMATIENVRSYVIVTFEKTAVDKSYVITTIRKSS